MGRVLVLLALASVAWVVACGGGTSHSVSNPSTGQTIAINTATLPGATAVVEVPTVAPTATAEAQLTQEQIVQITANVKQLISDGLSETPVTLADLSKIKDPTANNELLDPAYLARQLALCDMSRYGETLGPPEVNRRIASGERGYGGVFANGLRGRC